MNERFEKLLIDICAFCKSDSGYIFSKNGKDLIITNKYGDIDTSLKELKSINLLVTSPGNTLTEIKKSKAFTDLAKKYGYSSLYRYELAGKEKIKYYLVLFSTGKLPDSKTLSSKLQSLLKLAVENKVVEEKDSFKNKIEDLLNLNFPILISDKTLSFIKLNQKFAELLEVNKNGFTLDFLKGCKFFDKQNNLLQLEKLPFVLSTSKKEAVNNFRLKYSTENNDKWFTVNSIPIEDTGKELALSFFCDITKEVESEFAFKETASNISSVLYSTNADGSEYYFVTDAVRNLFGYSPEEVYSNKFLLLRTIEDADFKRFRDFINKLREGESSFVDYKMRDRFGKEHWVRHSGIPIIRNNDVVRIVGMINEITDEKVIQLKLQTSEERFRMLIDTADDLIFILNGFGYFSLVNENGAKALGYTPDEMLGKHFLEFIDKEDEPKIAEAFSKILSSNQVTTFEAAFLDRFDKGVTFEIHAKPLVSDGDVSGMISIGRNITDRKLDEQKIRDLNTKLVEANRIISIERERARHKISMLEELNKLKNDFISNISHELRTPLASVVGFAETIASDPDLPKDTLKEFSEIILSEGKRLAKLINDILEFSKLESGEEELKKETVLLLHLINEVIETFSIQLNEKQLHISREFPGNEITINGDRERLGQVFNNLVSNAVKFTNKGGRISVMVHDYGKEVEVTVTDTGIGIPEKDLPKLFQKFSKIYRPGAPVTGAGLGLARVKQIVELHKGVVRVKSEVDKGSTFIVRLPK